MCCWFTWDKYVFFLVCFCHYKADKEIKKTQEADKAKTIEAAKNTVREEAVAAGVARWTADEKGKPKFEWIVSQEKKP